MTNEIKNVPELRFPEFSGQWEARRLGDITVKIGSGKTPKGGSSVYKNEGIPFYRSQNIKDGFLDLNDVTYIDAETDFKMKNSRTYPDDVLLNITGASIGRSALNTYKASYANLNQHVCIIRMNTKFNPKFVSLYLTSNKGKKYIFLAQSGGSREGINFKEISKIKIHFPAKVEQQKISDFFSKLDQQIELEEQKLSLLEEQKKGYMQKIFSQELRFKDESEKEYSEWEEKGLKEISNIKKGEQINKKNIDVNGKYYHLNGGTSPSNRTNLYNTNPYTISISEGGNSCGFVKMNKEYFYSGGHNYTLLDLNINSFYLYSYLKYHEKNIMTLRVGSSLPNIQKKDISNYLINIPCENEQEKIGEFFKQIDIFIEKQSQKIGLLKERKKGFLQKMFV